MSESTKTESSDLDIVSSPQAEVGSSSASMAYLQRRLTAEQDSRKEERFTWSLFVMMLLDALILPTLTMSIVPVIVVLQLVFLWVFGRMCGQDDIYAITQRAIDTVSRGRKD